MFFELANIVSLVPGFVMSWRVIDKIPKHATIYLGYCYTRCIYYFLKMCKHQPSIIPLLGLCFSMTVATKYIFHIAPRDMSQHQEPLMTSQWLLILCFTSLQRMHPLLHIMVHVVVWRFWKNICL